MRHLLRGREVPVAIVSGIAATLAAGAFGLSAATADDPAPIELDAGSVEPVAPVPLGDVEPVAVDPSIVSPAEAEVTEPDPSAGSPDTPASPVSAVSPPSPQSPPTTDSAPSPNSPASAASAASPDSPPSAGSIDS